MTTVVLGKADLALFSDPTQRVQIPHLTAATVTPTYPGATVQFAGDTYPTAFSGTTRSRTWPLTARYLAGEQTQLLAFLTLLETAFAAADRRLLLRTHYGLVAGLDEAVAVVIFAVQQQPQAGLFVDVQFTAEQVEFTLAV